MWYIIRKLFKNSKCWAQFRIFITKGLNFRKSRISNSGVRHDLQTLYFGFSISSLWDLKNRLDHPDRMILRWVLRKRFWGGCRVVYFIFEMWVHAAFDLSSWSADRVFRVTRGLTYREDIPLQFSRRNYRIPS